MRTGKNKEGNDEKNALALAFRGDNTYIHTYKEEHLATSVLLTTSNQQPTQPIRVIS
jgi:hypothetical protein